jgi:hypothetical protein
MHLRFHRPSLYLLIVFFVVWSASCLSAQKVPEIDVYGGFSHIRFDSQTLGFSNYSSLNGWAASITAPHLYEQLGFTVNGSGESASQLKVYNFLLGPQFSVERGRLRLFGNILFGKAETKVEIHQPTRSEIASVGRAVAVGGGIDLNFAHHIAVRLIDADYIYSKTFHINQNYGRLSAGLVYQFGRK